MADQATPAAPAAAPDRATADIIKDIAALALRYGPGVAADAMALFGSINAETPRTETEIVAALDAASATVAAAVKTVHDAARVKHVTE